MQVKPEHIVYTDEQIANMIVRVVDDSKIDGSHLIVNTETGQLMALVRKSFAAEDEQYLRESLNILRIDWLGVLGYGNGEQPIL